MWCCAWQLTQMLRTECSATNETSTSSPSPRLWDHCRRGVERFFKSQRWGRTREKVSFGHYRIAHELQLPWLPEKDLNMINPAWGEGGGEEAHKPPSVTEELRIAEVSWGGGKISFF